MDTILTLEGQIGRDNLSTQAKKRITTYHNLKNQVKALERTYKDANEDEKESCEEELDSANEYFEKFKKATIDFLQDELEDFKASQQSKEDKIKADKIKADKEKADKLKKENVNADGTVDNTDDKDKDEKPMNITGFLIGGLVLVASFGAINYWKNRN